MKTSSSTATSSQPTLTELRKQFHGAGKEQHVRFDGKRLHTHAKYALSSVDFKAKFGSKDAIRERSALRQAAVQKVKDAIDKEYGAGMGQRVFGQLSRGYYPTPTAMKVSDLDSYASIAHRLALKDRLGNTSTTPLGDIIKECGIPLASYSREELETVMVKMTDAVLSKKAYEHPAHYRQAAVDALMAHVRESNRRNVQSHAPGGVTVAANGDLSGEHTIIKVPRNCTGQMMDSVGKEIVDVLSDAKRLALKRQREKTEQNAAGGLQSIGGHLIEKQAASDFYRLDFEIPGKDGKVFKSSEDEATAQAARNLNVANALREFTGSDEATTVLSAMMTQTSLSPLLGCLSTSDGEAMNHIRWASKMNTADRVMTVVKRNGEKVQVDTGVLGAARWKLSKDPNGDFRISVDWQAYGMAADTEDAKSKLPLHENGVIGAHFKIDFVINGTKARSGELSLTIPGGTKATFSGRVKLN